MQARRTDVLKREPRLQASMLRAWQHLMRCSPGLRLYCDVQMDWLLLPTSNDAARSAAGSPQRQLVDFVLCDPKNVPLVVVHLIDGPGLKHRREPQAVTTVNLMLRRLGSAGLCIWIWDAHALPPLDVLRRQVLRLRCPAGAAIGPAKVFRKRLDVARLGWLETQMRRLRSVLRHLHAWKASVKPTPSRRASEPTPSADDAASNEWRRLAPLLSGLDEPVLRGMLQALSRLLDKVPEARRVLRHARILEWGLHQWKSHAFLKLPLGVLAGAEQQLADLMDPAGDVRAIQALRAKLRSAAALRSARPTTVRRRAPHDAREVTSVGVREIGMSTFLDVDSTWKGHLRHRRQPVAALHAGRRRG